MSIRPEDFRKALSGFPSGVTVVTARTSSGDPVGVTVSAFSSLSLSPPLVLFCLDKNTTALEAFEAADHFVVNVLAEGQKDLSARFASAAGDRFEGVVYDVWQSDTPVFKDTVAALECRRVAVHDGGDHRIFIGEVIQAAEHDDRRPLVYCQGGYAKLV